MKALIECSYAALVAFGLVMFLAMIYGLKTSTSLFIFSLNCLAVTIIIAYILSWVNNQIESHQLTTSINTRN